MQRVMRDYFVLASFHIITGNCSTYVDGHKELITTKATISNNPHVCLSLYGIHFVGEEAETIDYQAASYFHLLFRTKLSYLLRAYKSRLYVDSIVMVERSRLKHQSKNSILFLLLLQPLVTCWLNVWNKQASIVISKTYF